MRAARSGGPRERWPILGVGGLVFDRRRVLLVRRGSRPAKGLWSIPGGKLRRGESVAEAVRRELLEETGLEVRVGPLVTVYERLPANESASGEGHYVVLDYLCERIGGSLGPGDDADDARWFALDALEHLRTTPGAEAVIRKGLGLQEGR